MSSSVSSTMTFPPPAPSSSSAGTIQASSGGAASPPPNSASTATSLSSPTFPPNLLPAPAVAPGGAANNGTAAAGPSSAAPPHGPPGHPSAAARSTTAGGGPGARPTAAHIQPTLPSAETQRHVAEARTALVASIGNMLDSELQSRARDLHANAAALDKQERDLAKATESLRKDNDKLGKMAADATRTIKELGNVQNWAEVLERQFLVLEETVRLVREGSGSRSGSRSRGGSGSESGGSRSGSRCSGSSCWGEGSEDGHDGARRAGGRMEVDEEEEEDMRMEGEVRLGDVGYDDEDGHFYRDDDFDGGLDDDDKGKGKDAERDAEHAGEMMDVDDAHCNMSETSQSVNLDGESSTGADSRAKGSETTSISAEV